ncbi:MAG TPA: hypothetical protein VEW69_12950, partial [Alphaproteobacteria bacterium]|nr:hypothetical protein [Alphaproteobacteria bacterium]
MRSLLTGNIRLRDLTVEHPVVHLRIGENGAATLPTPKTAQPMVFTVDRMQITNGELRLNESRLPFDFSGDSLSLKLAYHSGTKTYEVHGDIAKLSLRYGNARSPEGSLSLDALLRSNDLDIKALSMTMQKSSLQATGKITNFAHPEAHFRYRASVDIKAVAASAGVPPMKSGRLDLSGNLDYLDGKYSSTGDAALRAFEWHDTFVHVTGVEATSPFKVVPGNVSLPKVTARLLGGSAQGNIVIADAIPLHGKQKATPQRGTANFTIANLLVSDVARAISNARMPLDRINAEGAVSGEIKTSWVGSPRNAVSRVTVQVTAPQNPAVEQVPVSGQLDAVFNGGTQTIDVAKLVLSTRAIHVQASGTLGSKTAQAQISVSAEGLRELQPALAALSPETRLPIKVDGQASFNGAIFGQLEWPSLRGHLELRDFDSILEPPAKGSKPNLLTALASSSRQGLQRIHWDSLSGNLTYTPSGVAIQDGVLKRGTAEAHLTATAGLREGLLQSTSQVAFNMQVRNVTLEDAQKLTGTQYPLSGLLNANLHAAGTPTNLRGGGTVDVSKLAIAGEPFRSFRSDLNFAGQELQLNNLVLAHNGAQLSGRAAYNPVAQSFSFDLRGTRVELSDFGRFAPVRITIAGNADFHVTGSGTVDAPLLDGQLQVPDLVLNGEHSGSLRASAKSQGRDLLIQAQTRLENAIMDIDGAV